LSILWHDRYRIPESDQGLSDFLGLKKTDAALIRKQNVILVLQISPLNGPKTGQCPAAVVGLLLGSDILARG
jgi:hypothetical protein